MEMTTEQLVKAHALAVQALEGLNVLDPGLVRRIARGGTNEKVVAKAVREALAGAIPSSIEPERSYVLGFVFNEARTHTLLQFKNSSTRYPGKLNGFGAGVDGKVLNPAEFMALTFKEQTGIDTSALQWAPFGRYSLDPAFKRQPGSYSIRLFVTTLEDDEGFETFRNSAGDDVVRTPINLEVFARKGAQGIGWMVAAALEHLKFGTTFTAEIFPIQHLIDVDDAPLAKP
jgi:hypothetical protein